MAEVTTAKLDAPVTFMKDFLGPETANEVLTALLAEFPWKRHTSNIYGKVVAVPRMEVWVADHHYTYSRRTYQPAPWTPTLVKIKNDIEAALGTKFNSVLLNRYESGTDSVGWHADNEPAMSHDHPIASLSLGAIRSFQIRKGNGSVQTIELGHGSLLVMHAGMQKEWKHQVPKTKKPCGIRINLSLAN
jgi:alkylated DNA repair dioxygenase AlkB